MTWFLVLLVYRGGLDAPPAEHRISMPSLAECAVVADAINNRGSDVFAEAKCRAVRK